MSNLYPQEEERDPTAELEVKSNLQITTSMQNLAVQLGLVG